MCTEKCCVKFFVVILAFASVSLGVLLSDPDIYFDPDTIDFDYHPRVVLDDLSIDNYYLWIGGHDLVIDADILPILKVGLYPPGYVYSQFDYDVIPNVDYTADISGGNLTCTFNLPGLYHVRVTRMSGLSTIYAVFAETYIVEKAKVEKTSTSKKIPLPQGDLFLAENSDKTVDNAAKILENGGRNVERVDDRQEVIDAIKKKSQQLGRKIHAEIVGHGTNGNVSTGAGKKNVPDKQIDLNSVEKFQKEIDDYVDHITFQACNVGKGADGQKFLKILADSIGKAGAYDSSLIVVNQTHFALPVGGTWVEQDTLDKGAHNFNPTTADTSLMTPIEWDYGSDAVGYEVYLSPIEDAVTNRDPSAFAGVTMDNFFDPLFTELGQTYYYAVDSYGGIEPYFSDVWKFTVQNAIIVDNFDYDTNYGLIENWLFFDETRFSIVGDFRTTDQNSGRLSYDNSGESTSSILVRLFDAPQDWIEGGGDTLSIWLQSLDLSETDLIMLHLSDALGGSTMVDLFPLEIIMAGEDGYQWDIPFQQIIGVDLTQINQFSLFVESLSEVCEPGMCQGTILVDDIRVIVSSCPILESDINEDGEVNLDDLGIMAGEWLQFGCGTFEQ